MKKISLSVRKNMLLALALSTLCVFLSEKSHAQKNPSEIVPASVDSVNRSYVHVNANAGKDMISIQNNNGTHGIAKVYCQSGKKMSESILQAGINSIDISLLSPGAYIVCITLDGGETYNQKFNKE